MTVVLIVDFLITSKMFHDEGVPSSSSLENMIGVGELRV